MKNGFWHFFVSLPAAAVIYIPLILILPEFKGIPAADFSLFRFGIGFIALWGGVILIIWSYVALFKNGGIKSETDVLTPRLVKNGPYAVIRNPMAVGVVSVLIGESLYFGSVYVFIWALLVTAALVVYIIRIEEYKLANQFGQDYISYKMDVGRFWPRAEIFKKLFRR